MVGLLSRVLPAFAALAPLASAVCETRSGTAGSGFLTTPTGPVGGQTVSNKVLILARDNDGIEEAARGLRGYGIPYEGIAVSINGTTLPTLNSTATSGNYGGIVLVSEVIYEYAAGWYSALTTDQMNDLYNYQIAFGVRMTRLDVFPSADFGVNVSPQGSGCCATGVEQYISITNNTGFTTANLKTGATATTQGLWHYPATIINSTIAWEVASFAASGSFTSASTAAVVNDIGGRQQMVFFIGWATDWAATSNYLSHAWIHWMMRGAFLGKRKTYINAQVDDVGLSTELYSPNGTEFKIAVVDLEAHVTWMADINSRFPAGSAFMMDLGHNGNGDIIAVTDNNGHPKICTPNEAVDYDYPPDTPLEFQKPLGTGEDRWPAKWVNYTWTSECALLDTFTAWFNVSANREKYTHVSHTFSHQECNNATYHDVSRDIQFNQAWLKQIGIDQASGFSPNGIIPPAITGLHNGDAIRAWMDNGIKYVVGDNTRPILINPTNNYWPLISNVSTNGYAGLVIVPRYATNIYYNCDLPACTVAEWVATSAGKNDWNALIADAIATNSRNLLGLHADPYMFHQANMRYNNVATMTIGNQSNKRLSILMAWVEAVGQEMTRLTNWPILSLSHDKIAKYFMDRMTIDTVCMPSLQYQYDASGSNIIGATVTASSQCNVPVPVTVPVAASVSNAVATADNVGSEPTIMWITTSNGQPASISFQTPISVRH